jgi:S1-C subfamily serine protease
MQPLGDGFGGRGQAGVNAGMARTSKGRPGQRLAPRSIAVIAMILLTWSCAGSSPAPESPPPAEAAPEPPPAPRVQGQIDRAELEVILDAGLGRFLQGVETEPHVVDGRFVGFRLVSLWPRDPRFQGLALGPGDVVVRVNGQPIERPEQALQVWNGLRVASALFIEYLRDGEPRELRFAIVD